MTKTRHPYRVLFLAVIVMLAAGADIASAAQKPNFIVILADDLVYGDLACYGAKDIATPQIDQMAREGAKFTSSYVAPVCSPLVSLAGDPARENQVVVEYLNAAALRMP